MDEHEFRYRIDFIKFAVAHSQKLIELADNKCGIIIGIDGVVLGLMMGTVPSSLITAISASLAVILFSGSAFFAFLTILPRLDERSAESLSFFRKMTEKEREQHISNIESLDNEEILRNYAREDQILSGILNKKYQHLRYSLYLLIFAFLPLGFTLLVRFFGFLSQRS